MSIKRANCVDVIRFCDYQIVQGKCHHEGGGDLEQEGTEKIYGVKSGGDG